MVFLDQNPVVQTHAVIAGAAAAHRVLQCLAQPRERLAGVENGCIGSRDRIHKGAGVGGHAGKSLQEIERSALAGEQATGAAVNIAQHLFREYPAAVFRMPAHPSLRVDLAKNFIEPCVAAQHRCLTRDNFCVGSFVRRHQAGGNVAAADVFGKRSRDVAPDHRC